MSAIGHGVSAFPQFEQGAEIHGLLEFPCDLCKELMLHRDR